MTTERPEATGKVSRAIITAAMRRAQVIDLLNEGHRPVDIGKMMGLTRARVGQLRNEALARAVGESVQQYRAVQLAKLDVLQAELDRILKMRFVAFSQGRVMRPQRWSEAEHKWVDDPDAQPYEDVGPKLQAIATYRTLLERAAKLTGADNPTQVHVAASVEIKINGVDPGAVV